MRWTFSSSASLCLLFFLDLIYLLAQSKKRKKKERTLKRPLSITSWAFLVCWSLSKQAIRLLLSPYFKGFYLWRERNDNIFCWAFRKYKGRKVYMGGWGERHPVQNHAKKKKKKQEKSNRLCRDDKANTEDQRDWHHLLWLLSVLHTTNRGNVIPELRWRCSYHINSSIAAKLKWISWILVYWQ